MTVANVAAVDAAVMQILAADAELMALLPDGVYRDVAAAGATRFVIVQHQTHHDEEGFRAPVLEEFQYRITARVLETTSATVDAAALRIHTILQDTPITGIPGYTHMSTLRVERVRETEVDAIDSDIRWQLSGGDYEIVVSPD